MPDNGVEEVLWVESLANQGRCKVAGIVAQCSLADADVEFQLDALQEASPTRLRGIRYILDYDDGPFVESHSNATHVACSRHGLDYLRDPVAAAAFERGFSLLADRNLSFDLQCAPVQLKAAAALVGRHPFVRVCIDHLGKPRQLDAEMTAETEAKLAVWREGMQLLSKHPQVYVKLSMLGYAIPGWHTDAQKEAFLRSLVLETILLFGAHRCMFASNYHISAAVADSDGLLDSGPSIPTLYRHFQQWVQHLSKEDQARLFSETAAEFYRLL
jgi:predicted TIM-barrel fold metal-dependent hydrolase